MATPELAERKKRIAELRNQLNELAEQKEKAFQEKTALARTIGEQLGSVKGARSDRNKLTSDVKELKQQRDAVNEEIKKKIAIAKTFVKPPERPMGKPGRRRELSPLEKIRQIEEKIETEVMSFDKEKKLMKEIKDLKKKAEEEKGRVAAQKQRYDLEREIQDLKKRSNELHQQMQGIAQNSQEKHEAVLASSKGIDELKAQEEAAFKRFTELKQKFNDVNEQLKAELDHMKGLMPAMQEKRPERYEHRQTRKERDDADLKTKEHEVEEKIRRGEKLTTEDLLVYQETSKR